MVLQPLFFTSLHKNLGVEVWRDVKQNQTTLNCEKPGNKNKGKGNGAGLAWESQSHCFADEFPFTHAHSFGTDT